MIPTLISDFISDLKTQKMRAFLTMIAISWGTITIVLLLTFGEGLKIQIIRGMTGAGDRIIKIYGGTTTREYQGLKKGRRIRFTEEDIPILKENIPQIEYISAQYGHWNAVLTHGKKSASTFSVGVYPSFEIMRTMYPQPGSRFLNEEDLKQKRRVLFMGWELAERLFDDENPVGKSVAIDQIPFVVIGVMKKKVQTSMSNGPDAMRAVMPASTFRSVYGNRYVNQIVVRPKDPAEAEYVKQKIRHVLSRRHKFDPDDERAMPVWDFVEDEKITGKIFLGIQIFLGIIGLLTLIVAGVGVANIMFVVVKERTREIGIKMAVGARKNHILFQFLAESMLIAIIGGGIGIAFSLSVIQLMNMLPLEGGVWDYLGKPTLSPVIMLVTAFILSSIGILSGFFPARRAASVDPVESLRYE